MSYKDILVHLDASERSALRLKLAANLAVRHGAHLAGLFVVQLPPPSLFMSDTSLFDIRTAEDIFERMRQQAEVVRDRAERAFRDETAKQGVDGEWRSVEGDIAEAVASHARHADLAILGQADPDHPQADDARTVETAMLTSGRPILVIPYIGDFGHVGETVLVGWKDSREAARAVNDAIPFLRAARSVAIYEIASAQDQSSDGEFSAEAVVRHLARHEVRAKASHTISDGVSEGDILLNQASDIGADLLVIGGYGHSRAREFILGGVTRTLIQTMTVPVLFSH